MWKPEHRRAADRNHLRCPSDLPTLETTGRRRGTKTARASIDFSVSFSNMARPILTRDPFQSCYRCRPINSTSSALARGFVSPVRASPELLLQLPSHHHSCRPVMCYAFFKAHKRADRHASFQDSRAWAHRRGELYERRSADAKAARLPQLAQELVRLKVDVIAAIFTPCALAATREIPIFVIAGDPIGTGLVASLARPGGNITGLSNMGSEAAGYQSPADLPIEQPTKFELVINLKTASASVPTR